VQLFCNRTRLEEARRHHRPHGIIHCEKTAGGSLVGLSIRRAGPSAPEHRPEGLRVLATTVGTHQIDFALAEPPIPGSTVLLEPGTLRPERDLLRRLQAQTARLPWRPGGYQPYIERLQLRAQPFLGIGAERSALFVGRRLLLPLHPQWTVIGVTDLPPALASLGVSPFLQGKTGVIVGVGSLGGQVAHFLGAAGVERLILLDPDDLELANVRRHICGVPDLGLPKVHAVQEMLGAHGFPTCIETRAERAQVDDPDSVRATIGGADFVVCCADSAAARQFVNHSAVGTKVPAIIANVQLLPEPLGEIVSVIPNGRRGCLNCWRLEMVDAGLLEPSTQHDALDYPAPNPTVPSGLPFYQLSAVASAACDLVSVALSPGAVSHKWLMALDIAPSGFHDLEPRVPKIEVLSAHPACEVCCKT